MSTSSIIKLGLAAAAVAATAVTAVPASAEPHTACRMYLREEVIVDGDGDVPDVSVWVPYVDC